MLPVVLYTYFDSLELQYIKILVKTALATKEYSYQLIFHNTIAGTVQLLTEAKHFIYSTAPL